MTDRESATAPAPATAPPRRRGRNRTGVLQVITSTARRGAEVFAVDLNEALASRGRTMRTVALVPGAESNGLAVETLGRRMLGLRTLIEIRRQARASRVVVAHGSSAVVATAVATIGTRVPFVYRNIGDPSFWFDTPRRRRRMRWLLRRARTVVALWEGSASALREVGGQHLDVRVIPKGVPARRFAPVDAATRRKLRRRFHLADGGTVVVYIGSLSHEKNVAAAIEAVGSIPGARLLIVGGGPERDALVAAAAEVAPGRVTFAGVLERPSDALAAADVLILPSHTEGIPGVLIEAAFCELPVVATAVGGVSEIVADGETGVLVRAGDVPALAGAIRSATRDGRAKGKAGRRRCLERFEIEVIADRWDALLTELGAWGT